MEYSYLKVAWLHDADNEPVLLFRELNSNRYEVRKVEVFTDGSLGYAGDNLHSPSTRLGEMPLPPFEEITKAPQFVPEVISKNEFNEIWAKAKE